jgi:glycosyltransferase involved in cell wall biosynthesis
LNKIKKAFAGSANRRDKKYKKLKRSRSKKVPDTFLSVLDGIGQLAISQKSLNRAISTVFLMLYFVFKKASAPFNLSKIKSIFNKDIRINDDPIKANKKLKILFVTAMLPSKMHGGGTAMLNMIKKISKYDDISLISFIDFEEERGYVKYIKPYVKKIKIFERWSQRKVLDKGVGLIPDGFRDEFYCPEMVTEINSELKKEKYDILQFEYLQMGIYKDLCEIPRGTKVLLTDLEVINIAFWQRIAFFPLRVLWSDFKEYLRIFYFETFFLKRFSRIFVVTNSDAKNLLKYSPDLKITAYPSGVDFNYFSKIISREEFPSLVFLGNYQHVPNSEAVISFSRNILPRIRKKFPSIKFYVVGHMPGKAILKLAENDKNIIVTGTVKDVRPFIQMANIFIAPLKSGEGQRIKLLEAMAARKAVVSTPLGCRGIGAEDGRHLLVARNDREFADDVILLLEDPQLRKSLGDNAYELAKKFDWKNIAQERQKVYLKLLK